MPATTELLMNMVIILSEKLREARTMGDDCTDLQREHDALVKQINSANEALSESKHILRG